MLAIGRLSRTGIEGWRKDLGFSNPLVFSSAFLEFELMLRERFLFEDERSLIGILTLSKFGIGRALNGFGVTSNEDIVGDDYCY